MLERRAVPLTLTNSVPGSLGTQLDEGRGGAYFQDILGECEDLPHRGFPEDSEMDLFPLKPGLSQLGSHWLIWASNPG